jgi:methionyl-tRNA formyltransferase
LAELGARLLLELFPDLCEGRVAARAQREAEATYAHKLSKDEATLVWSLEAEVLARQVRAFNPWPIARTTIDGEMMLVRRARSLPSECGPHPPGTVTATGSLGIDVATGPGTLRLLEVQAAGRRAMSAAQFIHARPLEGRVLGS